jgi:hypothetical protein
MIRGVSGASFRCPRALIAPLPSRASAQRHVAGSALPPPPAQSSSAAASPAAADVPHAATATITRVLFTSVQPNHALRQLLSQRPPVPGGRGAIIFLLLSFLSAIFAGVRRFYMQRTRQCSACRGYGISACELCGCSGYIKWVGKWDHVEPCPQCMGRRFINCRECGGLHHRTLFMHVSRNAGVAASEGPRMPGALEPLVD